MKCANCGFEKHIDDSFYCQECGASLENLCTNNMCDFNNGEAVLLPFNAKFCPSCGAESTFKSLGYFDK
ncbi:hypothetical protein [Clostridium baratii]|uniref:hypothetical protein n=1 Tax=Clostridium baratii TaxID=1561 RepID=UPI0030CE22CD